MENNKMQPDTKIINGEEQHLIVNGQGNDLQEINNKSTDLEKSYEQGMGNENMSNNNRVNDSRNGEETLPGEYDDSKKKIHETKN